MKQVLPVFAIVAVSLSACSNNKSSVAEINALQAYKDSVRLTTDTAGLAQYRMWKVQHELNDPNEYNPYTATTAMAPVTKETIIYRAPVSRSATRTRSSSSGIYDRGSMASTSGHTAERVTRSGWSKAAKGAAIGAGGGAVLGAVINKKNPLVGGVLGGVLGGGVGYGIGRSMDKRDGRY